MQSRLREESKIRIDCNPFVRFFIHGKAIICNDIIKIKGTLLPAAGDIWTADISSLLNCLCFVIILAMVNFTFLWGHSPINNHPSSANTDSCVHKFMWVKSDDGKTLISEDAGDNEPFMAACVPIKNPSCLKTVHQNLTWMWHWSFSQFFISIKRIVLHK